MKSPSSISSVSAVWCKGDRGITLVFVSQSEQAHTTPRGVGACVSVYVCVWRGSGGVCGCVCGTGVQKVKVTWSVPVTVQWENQSTPVNEVWQVHQPSWPRMDAHYKFFFSFSFSLSLSLNHILSYFSQTLCSVLFSERMRIYINILMTKLNYFEHKCRVSLIFHI